MTINIKKLNPFGIMIESSVQGEDVRKLDLEELKSFFHREHLVVLRGFSDFKTKDEFSEYCALWGKISLWPFGKVLELIQQDDPKDHIFDNNYVPMHWDGMYRPEVPEIQLFQCVDSPRASEGGRTTFSNTALALENAPKATRALWAKVTGVYERKMEFYHSKTEAPIITTHPTKGFPVIRYCEPPRRGDESFINHPSYEFKGVSGDQLSTFLESMQTELYSKDNFYAHAWQKGDLVIADNHTLLHGREAFSKKTSRHLRRVHVLGENPLKNPHLVFHS